MKCNSCFLVLFMLYKCSTSANLSQYRSDYKLYYTDPQGWFKLHRVPANWREARLRCHLEGTVLASPSNPSLLQAMKTVLLRHELINFAVFTGIHATYSKGDYSSIEGIPLHRIPITWALGEPNNLNDEEQCLVMYGDGTMADVKCEATYPYLCYKEDTGVPLVHNECGTIDNEYKLNALTGSCYKFHSKGQDWERAYKTCVAEGGYLAIINSTVESQALVELYSKYPDNVLRVADPSMAYIGFSDLDQLGTWYTVHGKRLEDTGFGFAEGMPDNWNVAAYSCGTIYRNGVLNDMTCTTKLAFICEKKPDSLS